MKASAQGSKAIKKAKRVLGDKGSKTTNLTGLSDSSRLHLCPHGCCGSSLAATAGLEEGQGGSLG